MGREVFLYAGDDGRGHKVSNPGNGRDSLEARARHARENAAAAHRVAAAFAKRDGESDCLSEFAINLQRLGLELSEHMHTRELYIGGRWEAQSGTGSIDVLSASTEEVIGTVPEGTPADVDRAVRAARAAFEGQWGQTTVQERADWLRKLAGAL